MARVVPLEQETEHRTRLENAEKTTMTMAAELQAATEKVRAQGQQIDELKNEAKRNTIENMVLKLQLQNKNKRIRPGQVRYITRPKSEAMRVTREIRLPPRNRRACI